MRHLRLFGIAPSSALFCLSLGLTLSACGGGGDTDGDQGNVDRLDGGRDSSFNEPDVTVYFPDGDLPDVENMAPPEGCGDGLRPKDTAEECDDGNNLSGDGCDRRCVLEQGYNCDPNGGGCMPICGDGLVAGVETCDDGDTEASDGCGQTCLLEPGWGCPNAGQPCESLCGDSIEVGSEQCDYGDNDNGDGCSATCTVESGWVCGSGVCTAASCGDGIVAGTEVCDDGNAATPGCSVDCTAIEPYYTCPPLGGACTRYTRCGDGIFTADEACDDGDTDPNDGCSATCTIEDGYACTGGTLCAPICGDSKVRGGEVCDDGNAVTAGCSATCQLEPGYKCAPTGGACTAIRCGDGLTEGLEQCDDANNALGDGCTPSCKREPSCSNGTCVATCGDGIKATTEVCDDGNNKDGDGCRGNCSATEPGFACSAVNIDPPECVDLPLVLRDFKSFNNGTPGRHPDFNDLNAAELGIVRDTLGVDLNNDGVADSNPPAGTARSVVYALEGQSSNCTHGAANFNDWYHDNPRGKTVLSTMRVCDTARNGQYVFDNANFFPLDGRGWQDPSVPAVDREQNGANNHNFGFTSEVRFWFTFKGTEVLSFRGDDDVWVFINGRLAVDLGGVHGAQTQTITLNPAGNGVCSGSRCPSNTTRTLGLVVGRVYELVVFQAERHETASSYRLTLGNFLSTKTECAAICGDGVRTAGELCDAGGLCMGGANDGMACSTVASGACPGGTCQTLNDGGYGRCGVDCRSRGPFCGDATKQPEEMCDLGGAGNNGAYNGCSPTCTFGPRCGDMKLDLAYAEQCDQGAMNADGVYNVCSTQCKLGPRCGDSVIQTESGEQCDDGINKSSYNGCAPSCKYAPTCGDGVVQAAQGEQCDNGSTMNVGGYGGCNSNCTRASSCGDGTIDTASGEECDDGNANSFDGCSQQCRIEIILN